MTRKIEPLADGSGFRCLIRFATKQQRRFRIATTDPIVATQRVAELVQIGKAIRKAKIDPELGHGLLTAAGASSDDVRVVKAAVALIAGGLKVRKKVAATAGAPGVIVTFRQLAKAWTSGELADKHPDHVKSKRTADKDAERFETLNKTIGDVPVKAFSIADAELAMASLPKGLASATRRQYAQVMARALALAVYPLKLIPASPLPRGFLPKVRRTKATAWLYPSEDAKLLACADVPLARRVLYGFLAREGLRCGEALGMRWKDLDLARGVVRLDANKTDDPRAWMLAPGVATALKRYGEMTAGDLTFAVLNELRLAEAFRADLKRAGVDRVELFERSKTRQPIRVHDLRATFVTLSLAAGKSETWVSDRTGHRSSVMINGYRRGARTAAELALGELAPLDVAVPELDHPTTGQHHTDALQSSDGKHSGGCDAGAEHR